MEMVFLPVPVLALLAIQQMPAQVTAPALCIVQTKSDRNFTYDSSAGPFAIGMYKALIGHKLHDGTPVSIEVLAAATQKEVLQEVRRLQCTSVLQLWTHRDVDNDNYDPVTGTGFSSPEEPSIRDPVPIGDQNSLIFTLWDGATRKVLLRGAGPLPTGMDNFSASDGLHANGIRPMPYVAFAKNILKKLNKIY
jgi:hypothetical protein